MKKLTLEEFLLNSKGVWGSHWNYDKTFIDRLRMTSWL